MTMKKGIATIVAAMAMFCMMSMSVLADMDVVISLPENQVWTSGASIQRTGNYSYVWAGCDSVYPKSGTDNFSKIQARIVDSSGVLIMSKDYEVLSEESPIDTRLFIKEGYLNNRIVYIQFRGNTNKPAEAIVDYYSY